MALAFSASEEDVILRDASASVRATPSSSEQIVSKYFLEECSSWIRNHNFQTIALQFPDELLVDSARILFELERLTSRKLYILGDTTYGSCCVDEIAAEHASCDCLIHFGPSCLSPSSRLPVVLVFPRPADFDVEDFGNKLLDGVLAGFPDVVVLWDTKYHSGINAALLHRSHLRDDGFFAGTGFPTALAGVAAVGLAGEIRDILPDLTYSSLIVPDNQTVISVRDAQDGLCVSETLASSRQGLCLGRRFILTAESVDLPENCAFLYIGTESPSMVSLFFQLPSRPFYSYNPTAKALALESPQISRRIMRRYYLIEKAKDAQIVGILVGTLGVRDYLAIIERLKLVIKAAGKRYYTFVMGKPNPAKLANFMEVDVFTYVSCPESFFDSKEFLKPVITPHEMEIACGMRNIDAKFVQDFRQLLPGGSDYVDLKDPVSNEPDVSLITGKARFVARDEEEPVPKSSTDIVLRDHVLTVSSLVPSASDYLASRSWRGLDFHHEAPAVGEIVEGKHGIAESYEQEKPTAPGITCDELSGKENCPYSRTSCESGQL